MTVYRSAAGIPPLRRPQAHIHQMTALMVPVRATPEGRAWVPPARLSGPTTPPPDVDLTLLDLTAWTALDLLLLPLAAYLAAGWEPGRHRRPHYQPRHRQTHRTTTGGPR